MMWKKTVFWLHALFVELKGERKLERRCQFKFFENRGSFSSGLCFYKNDIEKFESEYSENGIVKFRAILKILESDLSSQKSESVYVK